MFPKQPPFRGGTGLANEFAVPVGFPLWLGGNSLPLWLCRLAGDATFSHNRMAFPKLEMTTVVQNAIPTLKSRLHLPGLPGGVVCHA